MRKNNSAGAFLELERIGKITDFKKWADILFLEITAFKDENGVYPNILIANESTYEKIDKEALKHRECMNWTGEGEPPEPDGIGSFSTSDCTVDFCMDTENELKTDEFKLVYDDSPDFGGENISEELQKEKCVFEYKMAA